MGGPLPISGAEPSAKANAPSYERDVLPILKSRCGACHGSDEPEGGLSFDRYRESSRIQTDFAIWEKVLRMIQQRQMPPEDAPQLGGEELQRLVAGIELELSRFDCGGQKHPGRVTIRRLNRSEFNNTVRDLVGIDFRPGNDFPSDDVGHGFDNIADVLSLPPILMEKYLAAAGQVVDKAFADAAARRRILSSQPASDPWQAEAVRRDLASFATRAFRRPATDDEIERLMNLRNRARQAGADEEEAFKAALQAVLVSPHFLFRIELDPADMAAGAIRELNGYELASRLSYFLWSSMPDEELFRQAADERLQDPDVLRAQVVRMLADPKAEALVQNFAGQWLQLRTLAELAPDPRRFPDFDEALRSAMRRETELFFANMVREDGSVLDFLGADYTFVNERLARHYGMSGVAGEQFRRVPLPGQRQGVLTHASILLLTSNPTRTSPVKRGKWILDNFLGEPPPPPPDGVEPLDENAEALGSLRERMEQHRSNAACAVCHLKMDALGFGLENFDVVGAWRQSDGRFEIDPSGTLPGGQQFAGPKDLMRILREEKRDEFCRCLAERMLVYALGRGLQSFDRCAVDAILKQLAADDYRFSALVQAVVTSDPFLLREGKKEP
jgi:hypothetical protein